MMYYVTHKKEYKGEIEEILNGHSSEAQMMSIALNDKKITFDMLISKLQDISHDQDSFDDFVKSLYHRGVLDIDDYTLAILKYDNTLCSTH